MVMGVKPRGGIFLFGRRAGNGVCSRRMKKFRNFLIWLAGVALFLLLTAHLTLRHALNTPRFKQGVTNFFQRTLNRDVEYERIEYRLFPFTLVMRQATIHERDSREDFATVQLLKLSVNRRQREITALRLESPTLRIVQRADGTFNFTDLTRQTKTKASPPPTTGEVAAPQPAEQETPASPPPPTLFLRLVDIAQARVEFTREREDGSAQTLVLSDLDAQVSYDAPGAPPKLEGRATIGQASSLQFLLETPADARESDGARPPSIALDTQWVIRDRADIQALLTESFPAFQNLQARLTLRGTLEKFSLQLDAQTDEPTATHPLALNAQATVECTLPKPLADYLENNAPLPDDWPPPPPSCEPPVGTIAFGNWPKLARILQRAEAQLHLSFAELAYGGHRFTDGAATAYLRGGNLIVPTATCTAYEGKLSARGNAQLLTCPASYRVESITGSDLDVLQLFAANDWTGSNDWFGKLQIKGSLTGQAVNAYVWPTLTANGTAQIDDLQSVGTGGTPMDAVWRELDQPLLLSLLPKLRSKVAAAQAAENTVTTTRYERATAQISLSGGVATLSAAELAMPDYRLRAGGTYQILADELQLTAHVLASPEETARLTGGRDLQAVLPHENGGLLVPVTIQGSLSRPQARPDVDHLLQNALQFDFKSDLAPALDSLSEKDQKQLQEGIQILQNLGTLLQVR